MTTPPKRRRSLTWEKATKRWSKVYRGKKYYFPFGASKSDESGYRLAVEAWEQKKRELVQSADSDKPHRDDYERAVSIREEMVRWIDLELTSPHKQHAAMAEQMGYVASEFPPLNVPDLPTDGSVVTAVEVAGDPATDKELHIEFIAVERAEYIASLKAERAKLVKEIERLRRDFSRVVPPALGTIDTLPVYPYDFASDWLNRIPTLRAFDRWTTSTPIAETIGKGIESFLAEKMREVQAGQKSLSWYGSLQSRLAHFTSFAGTRAIKAIDAPLLAAYRDSLLQMITAKQCAARTAKHRLDAVRMFVNWACGMGHIPTLPANLQRLTITVPQTKIQRFETAELRSLLQSVKNDRLKLCLLLMANCGCYQTDIATIIKSEVDFRHGTLTRQRSKTRRFDDAPTIQYPLWDETLRLLRQERLVSLKHLHKLGWQHRKELGIDRHTFLHTRNGMPLVKRQLSGTSTGKIVSSDSVRLMYDRLRRSNSTPLKPMMLIRKTSANILESHDIYRGCVVHFLAHDPDTVTAKYYVQPDQDRFVASVVWLGEQLGYPTLKR